MNLYTYRELQRIATDPALRLSIKNQGEVALETMNREYNAAPKCGGCDAIRVEDSHYCWKCGLDLTHIFQTIIDYKTEHITPVTHQKMYAKETAAKARLWLRAVLRGIHGISVKLAPGYSGHIYVKLPQEDHDCVTQSPDWKPWDAMREICPICTRHQKAARNLNNMLVHAFPHTSDKSDHMTDYYDFTWLVT